MSPGISSLQKQPPKSRFEGIESSGDWVIRRAGGTRAGIAGASVPGGVSVFAATARVLSLWTGSERFGESVVLSGGSSKIEPGVTPKQPVTLKWETFEEAANEAGMSRRYGGIHFARADLAGHKLGGLVADRAWAKAQTLFDGTAKPATSRITSSK